MRKYNEVLKEVDQLADKLGLPIDEHIKTVVIGLRMHDFPTSASCEGHLEDELPRAWVEIYEPEQTDRAWLAANNAQRERLGVLLNEYYRVNEIEEVFEYDDIGMFGGFRLIIKDTQTVAMSKELLQKQQNDFDNLGTYLIGLVD